MLDSTEYSNLVKEDVQKNSTLSLESLKSNVIDDVSNLFHLGGI